VRPGNSVRPLIDGIPAFRRICEAIEMARSSVWVTVTFMWAAFEMPDGCGSALDVLDWVAARGIDVRLIFWRPDAETESLKTNAFWGSAEHIHQLETRKSGIKVRWDRAHPGFCQHQKSRIIDAGDENEIAFVGGINLNPNSMAFPGHRGAGQTHDVYVEIAGPSTVDVNHNFVQRWNEASERFTEDGRWGSGSETDLPFPISIPRQCGSALVQIQRTIHSDRYTNGAAPPGGKAFDIARGEQSIFDQYCIAIDAARRSIHIENQYVAVLEIVECLHRALQRGVEVVLLVPAEPDGLMRYVAASSQSFLEAWTQLGEFKNFTLSGIARLSDDGQRKSIYVHDKLMLVDDAWATVGSCNLHSFSIFGNGEMNASFRDPEAVHMFRCELFQEHLDQDTSHMDDREALRYFRKVALENRERFKVGNTACQGLTFAIDPASYG